MGAKLSGARAHNTNLYNYAAATVIVLSIFVEVAIPSDSSKNNQRRHRQILSLIKLPTTVRIQFLVKSLFTSLFCYFKLFDSAYRSTPCLFLTAYYTNIFHSSFCDLFTPQSPHLTSFYYQVFSVVSILSF